MSIPRMVAINISMVALALVTMIVPLCSTLDGIIRIIRGPILSRGGGKWPGRVLSTEQAKTSIQQVQAIINGGLTDQISQLDAQGKMLSNPDVWDGPLAQQFRDQTWPETKAALDKAKQELDQLREQLQKIAQNIMTAGGGA